MRSAVGAASKTLGTQWARIFFFKFSRLDFVMGGVGGFLFLVSERLSQTRGTPVKERRRQLVPNAFKIAPQL